VRALLAAELHPGWIGFRRLWALAVGLTWLSRAPQIPALYSRDALIVQAAGSALPIPPALAWALWALLLAGVALVGLGARARLGAAMALVALLAFRVASPDYVYLYDQLALWQAFALLFQPSDAGRAPGDPLGRYLLTLSYVGLYAGTGLSKLARTSSWFWGAPLSLWLVDSHFAGGSLARALSVSPVALAVMGSTTVLFEAGFPLALLHRWTLRIWLLMGVGLHLGILVLMRVHTFSLVALSAYPLLLSAEDATAIAAWLGRLRRRL